MKESTKRIIIGLGTITLIVFMVIFIDIDKIINNLSKISFYGICLFFVVYTLVFLIRSLRLKYILKALNKQSNYISLLGSYGIGWAMNELTPGKLGDLARIEVIYEENDIGLSKSFCGIAIERFIDLFILFLISIFALVYVYFVGVPNVLILNLQIYLLIGSLIIFSGIIILLILFIKPQWILNPVGKISLKLKRLLENFLGNFLEGIRDFRNNYKKAGFVFLISFPIWILETLTLVIVFTLTGFIINPFIIILAQILIFFSKTFPITPGGWVISENLGALFIYLLIPSIPFEDILSLFILDHMLRISYVFIYGIISGISFNFKMKNLKKIEDGS
jgi:uncharacterized protein (TIRG00374 family)